MNKNTLGSEAFEDREPLAPVTRGLEFVEASIHQYPPMRSEMPLPKMEELLDQIRLA